MLEFTDTHCHIHEAIKTPGGDNFLFEKWQAAGITDPKILVQEAADAGVTKLLIVGNTLADSKLAADFVQGQPNCWATIGIHPHESAGHSSEEMLEEFAALAAKPKIVAIGECGLDYYYNHSPQATQREVFEFQLKLAQKHDLPLVFHVRDGNSSVEAAFEDFFAILDRFQGIRGVVHSFTANQDVLDKCLSRGLYIGLNGIMTFTKNDEQLAAAKAVPLSKLLLETDAPFLTPTPYRGTICQPKHVCATAEFLSNLRGESLQQLALATTHNAKALFTLD